MAEYKDIEVKQVEKKERSKGDEDKSTTYSAVLESATADLKIKISSSTPLGFVPKTKGLTMVINNPQKTLKPQ